MRPLLLCYWLWKYVMKVKVAFACVLLSFPFHLVTHFPISHSTKHSRISKHLVTERNFGLLFYPYSGALRRTLAPHITKALVIAQS